MPTIFDIPVGGSYALEQSLALIYDLIAPDKKVRPVVTRSGKRARGNLAFKKAVGISRFESLVEDDGSRVLDVATMVLRFANHPVVLQLGGSLKLNYTPDHMVLLRDQCLLLEIKGDYWLTQPKVQLRLRQVIAALRHHGLRLVVMTESDVREAGLQQELKELYRIRPATGRFRAQFDLDLWDPSSAEPPPPELAERWKTAQRVCDDLLVRVMKRDPEDLLPELVR